MFHYHYPYGWPQARPCPACGYCPTCGRPPVIHPWHPPVIHPVWHHPIHSTTQQAIARLAGRNA